MAPVEIGNALVGGLDPAVAKRLREVSDEAAAAREKYPLAHDRMQGVHHLVTEAERRVHGWGNGRSCGYYHREDLVVAMGLLLNALEVMDASTDTPHDE